MKETRPTTGKAMYKPKKEGCCPAGHTYINSWHNEPVTVKPALFTDGTRPRNYRK
jgi:hypothetical protein